MLVKCSLVRDDEAQPTNTQAMPFRVEHDRDSPVETATVSSELVAFQRFFPPAMSSV